METVLPRNSAWSQGPPRFKAYACDVRSAHCEARTHDGFTASRDDQQHVTVAPTKSTAMMASRVSHFKSLVHSQEQDSASSQPALHRLCHQSKQRVSDNGVPQVTIRAYRYKPQWEIKKLFQQLCEEADTMSPKKAARCLQIPAKLVSKTKLGPDTVGYQRLMEVLANRVVETLPATVSPRSGFRAMKAANMCPKDIALAAWSCGRLDFHHPSLMRSLAWMTLGCLHHKDHDDETNGSYKVKSIDIANLLWACSRLRYRNYQFLSSLVQEAARLLDEFDAHSIASTFVALGALELRETRLTPPSPERRRSHPRSTGDDPSTTPLTPRSRTVKTTLQRKLYDFDTRRLCNFLWSCAKLNWKSTAILDTVMTLLLPRVTDMQPQHLANAMWSCGQLHLEDSALIPAVVAHLLSPTQHGTLHLHDQDAQGISNIIWAAGRLNLTNHVFLKELQNAACRLRRTLLPQHLSNIIWASGRLGYCDAGALKLLLQVVADKLETLTPQNIANVYWGVGKLRSTIEGCPLFPLPAASGRIVQVLLAKIQLFETQSVSNMLLACAYLGWSHPEVTKALVKRMETLCLIGARLQLSPSRRRYSECGSGGRMVPPPLLPTLVHQRTEDLTTTTSSSSSPRDSPKTDETVHLSYNEDASRPCQALDFQHLSNICWVVGTIQRDQNVSLGDRELLPHHVFRLFSIFAHLLLAQHHGETMLLQRRETPSNGRGYFDSAGTETEGKMLSGGFVGVPLQHLSLMLWGFASVRLRHDEVFNILCDEVGRRLRCMDHALNHFFCRHNARQSCSFQGSLDEEDPVFTARRVVPSLCQTIWALGRVFFRRWDIIASTVRMLLEDYDRQQGGCVEQSWFWRVATLHNASNILWGLAVVIHGTKEESDKLVYVRSGILAQNSPAYDEHVDGSPPSDAEIDDLESGLSQLCLITARLFFQESPSVVEEQQQPQLDPRDMTQMFHAMLASRNILQRRLVNHSFHDCSATARDLREVTFHMERLKARMQLRDGHVSEVHTCVREALRRLFPTMRDATTTTTPTFLSAPHQLQMEEEYINEDLISCDIVIRKPSLVSHHPPVVLEVDGPWHYIRVIGKRAIQDLSPLSPETAHYRLDTLSETAPGQRRLPSPPLPLFGTAEDAARERNGFLVCLDGRTRLKRRLLQEKGAIVVNLPFYEIASFGQQQLEHYLLERLGAHVA